MNKTKIGSVMAMFATFGLLIFSCVKDKGTAPKSGITTTGGTTTGGSGVNFCDTITYAKHIKPIITNNCISCHTPGGAGGFSLLGYDDLKVKAEAGRIKARVIDPVPNPMPPTGHLPQPQLDLISCWLNNGYKP